MSSRVDRDTQMAVSRESLFRAITDFESYPKFLTEVVSAKRLTGSTKERVKVEFEIEVVKRFQYSLEFSVKAPDEVSWKLLESNFFKTNSGLWRLKEKGNSATDVHYELDVAFGFLVPSWVSKKLTEVNLPKMFEAFEGRAREMAESK